jgi:8-oxo-dGTP diphosphatase
MTACGEYISLDEQSKLPKLYVSAGVLIDLDNKLLITKKANDSKYPGKWEFPGGKMNQGESPEYALIRELKEELSIDVPASCLSPLTFVSYSYSDFHLIMFLFTCRNWTGNIIASEHQHLKWIDVSELKKYDMHDANKQLITYIYDIM